MTIVDVKNQLISHFLTRTYFAPADYSTLKIAADLEEHRDSLIRAAFGELEKADMVKGLIEGDGTMSWILTRPFSDFIQEVPISPQAAELVANTVNQFIAANDLDWPMVDKMDMEEADLIALVQVVRELLEHNALQGLDDEGDLHGGN